MWSPFPHDFAAPRGEASEPPVLVGVRRTHQATPGGMDLASHVQGGHRRPCARARGHVLRPFCVSWEAGGGMWLGVGEHERSALLRLAASPRRALRKADNAATLDGPRAGDGSAFSASTRAVLIFGLPMPAGSEGQGWCATKAEARALIPFRGTSNKVTGLPSRHSTSAVEQATRDRHSVCADVRSSCAEDMPLVKRQAMHFLLAPQVREATGTVSLSSPTERNFCGSGARCWPLTWAPTSVSEYPTTKIRSSCGFDIRRS